MSSINEARKFIIPAAFRFSPTDEEIIWYLGRKAMGLPLPRIDHLLERDLYGENAAPWCVFSNVNDSLWYTTVVDREKEKIKNVESTIHVFTKLSKVAAGKSRIARRAGSGIWDGQTGGKNIKSGTGAIIGTKKMFSFLGKNSNTTRKNVDVHWIMHEYSLAGVSLINNESINKDIVLCKIKKLYKEKIVPLVIEPPRISRFSALSDCAVVTPPPEPLAPRQMEDFGEWSSCLSMASQLLSAPSISTDVTSINIIGGARCEDFGQFQLQTVSTDGLMTPEKFNAEVGAQESQIDDTIDFEFLDFSDLSQYVP